MEVNVLRQKRLCKSAKVLAATWIFLVMMTPVLAADAWTAAKVSPAIHQPGADVVVEYSPTQFPTTIPAQSQITRVYANRSYRGSVAVQTSLCWNGTSTCVPLTGTDINTDAFAGLDAAKPMYLVHKIKGQKPLTLPLFVSGNVVVWFAK